MNLPLRSTLLCFKSVPLILSLSGCSQIESLSSPGNSLPETSPSPVVARVQAGAAQARTSSLLWRNSFQESDWLSQWQLKNQGSWGLDNLSVVSEPGRPLAQFLRVRYRAGSASPAATRKEGAPVGGAQFYGTLGMAPRQSLKLSYSVRFAPNFNFVKGGKLPGLFGGTMTSGGRIPDGTNGFSTRFMWRRGGAGEAYAYLPSSQAYGTSLGRGKWFFQPGVWHRIEQVVTLNQPGKSDGSLQVWVDDRPVLAQQQLTFRTTDQLKIEGIFFSTFFGGEDTSWATPQDTYIDFANFSVFEH